MPAREGDLHTSIKAQRIQSAGRKDLNKEGLAKALEMIRTETPGWKDFAAGGKARGATRRQETAKAETRVIARC